MDSGILAWIIPSATIFGGAVGWVVTQYKYRRETKRQAGLDANQTLKEKKSLLEELIFKTENGDKKAEFQRCLDDVNTALIGLSTARVRRTLNDAGLPAENILITEGKNQLKPQQIIKIKEEISEVKTLPLSNSIQELLTLANAHYYVEQYQESRDIYDKILSISPNNPIALNGRGISYGQLERFQEALADFELSLKLRPNDIIALVNRGNTYTCLGRYNEAIADLNNSLKLNPKEPSAINNLGNIYFRQGKYKEALIEFNRSLNIRPNDLLTTANRGMAYSKLGIFDKALSDFDYVLSLKPGDSGILFDLACLFSLQNKIYNALVYLEKAVEKDKKNKEKAKTDVDFDNIRNDPRFKKLIEED